MSQKAGTLSTGMPKVDFSVRQHLLPPLLGIGVMLFIYGMLNFPFLEAQAGYYWSRLAPVASTHAVTAVAPDSNSSELMIPSISVKAPVIYETKADNARIAYDLRSGVVHYGTTALPGRAGNVVIFGHSSEVAWAAGDYKFIFTLLNKLKAGQQVTLDYKGTRYVYLVTDSQVVPPTDMKALASNGSASTLSLITCTPVGTSTNRLVVHAKQVYPNPEENTPFVPVATSSLSLLPGN